MTLTRVTLTDAALIVHQQIAEKYGADPAVLDGLHFETRRLPIGTTGRMATALLAWPEGEVITPANLCWAVAGEFDFRADDPRALYR